MPESGIQNREGRILSGIQQPRRLLKAAKQMCSLIRGVLVGVVL
jgi:hypothetical protein